MERVGEEEGEGDKEDGKKEEVWVRGKEEREEDRCLKGRKKGGRPMEEGMEDLMQARVCRREGEGEDSKWEEGQEEEGEDQEENSRHSWPRGYRPSRS
jgi:hypothetical protein